ncbi:acyltransferase family protein [Cetobacterium sp.]|uniref:acyltransferase family protein n=1 Tax=Cetobacterium sp. TaxID=2071632 RepID=UPI003F357DB9
MLFMLLLHLFCTKSYSGLFQPIIYVGKYPLIYYLALFGDCCVALYCFCSGYGLMHNYQKDKAGYSKKNRNRIFNLYIKYWIITVLFVLSGGALLNKPGYPGSINKFLLTVAGIAPAYNGAWWFFTTSILLVLFSKRIYEVILKRNSIFIVCFNLISKKECVSNFFRYMGKHSTNLWLIHMFFYIIYFKKLVYSPKYPILIYIWLIILCLPFSYLIEKVEENTKNIALNYKNTK